MSVSNFQIEDSPRTLDMVRHSVRVDYGGSIGRRERLWYEIPAGMATGWSRRGDAWLISLLPLAVTLKSSLRLVDLTVDPVLLKNSRRLMAVWSDWYPEISPVEIETEVDAPSPNLQERRTAAFFSGGVDSFYTLLTYDQNHSERIDDLVFIHGFDIAIDNDKAYRTALERWRTLAAKVGKRVIPVASNLRETRFRWASWDEIAFGCMLAGVGHQLASHYKTIIINSGLPLAHLRPHASHPETDPLFSSTQTRFRQYGQELVRHDKIQHLVNEPLALNNMRVCFQSESGGNCGRCLKCMVIMSILECYGVLAHAEAFPGSTLDLEVLRKTYISQGSISFRNIQQFARERGRDDIAAAIEEAFARTEMLDRWFGLRWVRLLRGRFRRHVTLRRWTADLRPALYRLGRRINERLS